MKKDYKMYGFAAAAIMFVFGIYLMGHAGANYLQSNEAQAAESGALFSILSLKSAAMIQLFAGIIVMVIGILVYFVFLKKRFDEEV